MFIYDDVHGKKIMFIHSDLTEHSIIFAFLISLVGLNLCKAASIPGLVLFLLFLRARRSLPGLLLLGMDDGVGLSST